MIEIPIQDVTSQKLNVILAGQDCTIELYQRGVTYYSGESHYTDLNYTDLDHYTDVGVNSVETSGMYCNLYIDDSLVIGGVVCQNQSKIVRGTYLGFIGDLTFIDTQDDSDPTYPGLGSRFLFVYIEEGDI